MCVNVTCQWIDSSYERLHHTALFLRTTGDGALAEDAARVIELLPGAVLHGVARAGEWQCDVAGAAGVEVRVARRG